MADSDDGLPAEEAEMSEADIGSDEEDERGSSAEEGSDEENDEEEGSDEEGSGDESPSERRRPRKKHKPFVAPPPRALPQRTTRGARVAAEAGEEGDEEFWNQEFFAEEANDDRYETESEPEDRFDADFSESEQEGDEDEEAAEAEADAKEKKKKTLRPPGYKKPPLPKAKPKAAAAAAGDSQDGSGGEQGDGSGAKKRGGGKQRRSSVGSGDFTVGRRTVRDSTRLKVEEGELERKMAVKYKPRRAPQRSSNYKPLTQAELLAEAAKTEIENTKSLQMLVAMEEETKKRAQVHKKRYAGPMVRWKSRKVAEEEMSTLEVRNMAVPDELRRQVAPLPPPRQLCAVTGQPARFFDPLTRLPYASLEAYRELRRRREAGQLGGAPPGGVPQQGQQQQQQQQHSQGHVPIALPGMPAMPLQEQQGMPQQFLQLPTAMFQQPQLQQQFPDLPMPLPDLGQQLQPLPFLPPTAAGGGGTFF